MNEIRTATIIGGGIAGTVAAMALQRAGIEAKVFEAYGQAPEGVGAALIVAPNGINALRVLDLDGPIEAIGIPSPRMVVQSWTGKQLAEFRELPGLPVARTISRPELHGELARQAADRGIAIEYGKEFVASREGDDGVTAIFADGSEASADVLIGADGIHSAVRRHIDPAGAGPEFGDLCGFGGWVDDLGLEPTDGAYRMVFGKRGFFAHFVAADGRTLWFANIASEQPLSIAEAEAIPAERWLTELRETFTEDRCPALAILDRVRPADLMTTGTALRLPTPARWHRGRCIILGDAAHATSSSSGQGASMAIESALQLAMELRDADSIGSAFDSYERVRRPRVEKVIAHGKRTESKKAPGPVGRILRDLLLPPAMKLVAKPEGMRWLLAYEIQWDGSPAARAGKAVVR
jgi:FAD-dependent urate hydroxylase